MTNNKNVPECVHSAVIEAFSKLEDRAYDKKNVKNVLTKRVAVVALAAAMCMALVVSTFAYGDEIFAAISKRKKELIEDKQAHINETVEAGDVSLTVTNVTVNSQDANMNDISLDVTLQNNGGQFDNGIACSASKLERLVKEGDEFVSLDGHKYEAGEWYTVYAYDENDPDPNPNQHVERSDHSLNVDYALERANRELQGATDTINISYHFLGDCGSYRLTYYNLKSADGSVVYADEISVEFSFDTEDVQPLQQLEITDPGIEFEIEGYKYQLTWVVIDPTVIRLHITNNDMDTVTIGDTDYLAINLISDFNCTPEFVDTYKRRDELKLIEKERELTEAEKEEMNDVVFRNLLASLPTEDNELLEHCYELAIDLSPECGAYATYIQRGGSQMMRPTLPTEDIEIELQIELSSPVYVQDIQRVYFVKTGEPEKQVTVFTQDDLH